MPRVITRFNLHPPQPRLYVATNEALTEKCDEFKRRYEKYYSPDRGYLISMKKNDLIRILRRRVNASGEFLATTGRNKSDLVNLIQADDVIFFSSHYRQLTPLLKEEITQALGHWQTSLEDYQRPFASVRLDDHRSIVVSHGSCRQVNSGNIFSDGLVDFLMGAYQVQNDSIAAVAKGMCVIFLP